MALDLRKHTFSSPKFESVIDEAMRFMLLSPVHALPVDTRFGGAGVYAIYYSGGFEHYKHIAAVNEHEAKLPIYVGKAVPPGWRVGRTGRAGANVRPLQARLLEHARNIDAVENLHVSDFCCRFMILGGTETDLITACEAQMIRNFEPLWNAVVDGFGNHTPGKGRFDQAKSEWDVLHSGRAWAERCRGVPPDLSQILADIDNHRRR